MTEGYLQILIESLEKKIQVLDKIIELDEQQAIVSSRQPFDMEAYDRTMEEKGGYIEELGKLDDGFGSTFEIIKDEVKTSPQKYQNQIQTLQKLIREAVDKGITIEAQEKRNKSAMEVALAAKRQQIKQWKVSKSAAHQYYKTMSGINTVDPQLMDRKK